MKIASNGKFLLATYTLCLAVIGIIQIFEGPQLEPDTIKYLEMSPQRPPVYPLFLSLFKIFGEFHLNVVIIVQIFLNIVALVWFIHTIKKIFNLSALSLYLLLPLIVFVYEHYFYAHSILTESLTVPLFLVLSSLLIKSTVNRDYCLLVKAMVINVVLVLSRGQFLFLYPLFVLCVVYFYLYNRNHIKLLKYIGLIILIFVGQSMLQRTYHYLKHGEFISTPRAKMALAANAFYVASEKDSIQFTKQEDRYLFRTIYDTLYAQNYILESFNKNAAEWQEGKTATYMAKRQVNHYSSSFNEILHRNINPIMQEHYSQFEGIELWKIIDEKSADLALPLIRANWLKFLKNNLMDVAITGFGSRMNILIYFIFLIATVISVYYQNKFAVILSLFLTMHLLNFLLVSIAGYIIFRYSLYTSFMLLICILSILFKNLFENTSNSEKLISKSVNSGID